MENKINVAELLKNCPKGMELDCTMFDNVTFVRVDNDKRQFPIEIAVGGLRSKYLTKEGCFHDPMLLPEAKCVIFPKGKTTWEGFVPPCKFKDGDIISSGDYIAIFYKIGTPCHCKSPNVVYYHCYYSPKWRKFKKELSFGIGISTEFKYATEEEKEELFKEIKANGYKWNAETKTLEKLIQPKFKVGDKVVHKNNHNVIFTISNIEADYYICCAKKLVFQFSDQDDYELVPNKFDISALNPFDKVLVRQNVSGKWGIDFFGGYAKGFYYTTGNSMYVQCIPYEGNKHLRGTTNNCDDFYKTWE